MNRLSRFRGDVVRLNRIVVYAVCVLTCVTVGRTLLAAELPGHYLDLMEAEVKPLLTETNLESNPGAMFAAAVLYSKWHPANPSFGDKKKVKVAGPGKKVKKVMKTGALVHMGGAVAAPKAPVMKKSPKVMKKVLTLKVVIPVKKIAMKKK